MLAVALVEVFMLCPLLPFRCGVRDRGSIRSRLHAEDPFAQLVELVARLRKEKEAAVEEAAAARAEAAEAQADAARLADEVKALQTERKQVRGRIEKLLGQIDQLGAS